MDLKKFVLEGNPVCRKEAAIVGDHFRITMLTTALIRFEYSEDGGFEDRATQMVCNRDFPVPEFRVSDGGEELHIYTKDLEIHYDRQKFSPSGLMIRVAGGKASERVWHYGDEPKDLLGTARTLDEADGEIPLSHGIMSRNGFSVLDDSHTMAMGEDGMVEPRQGNRADFYFFGYGHRYVECLQDFYRLCGKTPLLPRYTFGNWWSRYYKYSEESYMELMDKFDEKNIQKLYEIRRKFGMPGKHPASLCLNKDGKNCHNCGGACQDGEFKKFPGYQYDFVGGGDSQPEAGTADKSEAELVAEITKQVMAQLGMK